MADPENFSEKYYFNYFFPLEKIPVVNADDIKLDEYIRLNIPVVIKNSYLVDSACKKWTLDYLKEHLNTSEYHVFCAKTNRFLYWDDKNNTNVKNFNKPSESLKMPFNEFIDKIKNSKPDDEFKYYLQQSFKSTTDKELITDFSNFNWKWVMEKAKIGKWGDLTSNVLFIGQPTNITPAHYDEQENFFAQVSGYKRCLLFSPAQFACLYTFPCHHPCDRQSKTDLRNPDFERFPRLKELKGYEAIVGPGDILYIPTYWFHQIESLKDITVSVNFWFKARSLNTSEITYPLKPDQKVAMTRNIEKMIATALVNTDELPEFFQMLTLGRYTN